MFWRILRKSLLTRKSHFAVAVIAVTMGALLVAATSTISLNIKDKISRELRAYGPNLSLLPMTQALGIENGAILVENSYLWQKDLISILNDPELLNVSPVLEGTIKVNDQVTGLLGMDWDVAKKIHPWWELKGGVPEKDSVVIGQEFAKWFNLSINQRLTLHSGQKTFELNVAGVVQTGGDEDNQILADLATTQTILGTVGQVSRLDLSVLSTKTSVETKGAELEKKAPGSRTKVIQQVAHAEERLLEKIQALMYFVTFGVLIVSLLSIAGTMTTAVIQRRKEIGIMKAIGASNKEIAKLFFTEATVFGVLGGVLGLILGFSLAQVIGLTVFSTSMVFPPIIIPITVGCACLVTWVASSKPVIQAVSVEPAITLRGE
ncbi:MAG: FtsX-like permease family protein [Desulfitobacteriaceae bacterium]